MKQSHFITLVSALSDKEVAEDLAKRLDFHFEPHTSDYLGDYLLYKGMCADVISVGRNRLPTGDLRQPNHPDGYCVVEVTINSGRNADKRAKLKFLLNSLQQIDSLTLLGVKTVDSEDF